MSITHLTYHRTVDGALGVELLSSFRSYIEKSPGVLV
jgi:pyruvate/2-oxoglutarate dehydrogenase complex dihydrolipoamide acyltransferase (E2) component